MVLGIASLFLVLLAVVFVILVIFELPFPISAPASTTASSAILLTSISSPSLVLLLFRIKRAFLVLFGHKKY